MAVEHLVDIEVRFAETDAMGVVHHSAYWVWFEYARVKLLEAQGFSYHDFEQKGEHLPMLEGKIRYLKPVYFGDKVSILTQVRRTSFTLLAFSYEIWVEGPAEAVLVNQAESWHAFVQKNGVPIKFPKALQAIFPIDA